MATIVYFLAIIALASAATFRGQLDGKPMEITHKQGCYIRDINDVIPFGTVVKPIGECVRITCGRRVIEYATCGLIGTSDPQCYVTKGDLTKPYPDCCPNIECESDNYVI